MLPKLEPMRLTRRPEPFDHAEWIFELKLDGFRALAYLENGEGCLVSRNGNTFASFRDLAADVAASFRATDAVLDGEIVCLDEHGCPQFEDLMFRRGKLFFVAFDALWIDGADLREMPLLDRKRGLRRVVPRGRSASRLRYLDHVEADGCLLFEQIVKMDLEGIVCKRKDSPYKVTEKPSRHWIKVKNPNYSQAEGREELFERV